MSKRGAPQQGDHHFSVTHDGRAYSGSFSLEHGYLSVWMTDRHGVMVGPMTERFIGTPPQAEMRAKRIVEEHLEGRSF